MQLTDFSLPLLKVSLVSFDPARCITFGRSHGRKYIREVRTIETKENSQKGLNNKGNINIVTKHSQGLLVLSLGL